MATTRVGRSSGGRCGADDRAVRGTTALSQALAEGSWKGGEGTAKDLTVILEAIGDSVDAGGQEYRRRLEEEFRPEVVVVRGRSSGCRESRPTLGR